MPGRILVLDDEASYARMVQELLLADGFQAETETDPPAALARLKEQPVDLVVADYKMPGMDGAEFLVEARKLLPELPVIMISGLMNTPELIKVANIGVTVVLEKPLETQVFLSYVRRFSNRDSEEGASSPASSRRQGDSVGQPVLDMGEGEYYDPTQFSATTKYFVALSSCGRAFLEQLKGAVASRRHVLVGCPPGSEFSHLTNEVSRWLGYDGCRGFHFSAIQLEDEATRKILGQLPDEPRVSNVVAISDLEDLDLAGLSNVFKSISPEGSGGETAGLTFIYRIGNLETLSESGLDQPALASLQAATLHLPPLRERVADLAAYARRFLGHYAKAVRAPGKKRISPDAMRLILSYDWPGNFAELTETLKRAVENGEPDSLTADDLEAALREFHGEVAIHYRKSLELKSFLGGAQSRFLRQMLDSRPDEARALLREAGLTESDLTEGRAERLLYPHLLEKRS